MAKSPFDMSPLEVRRVINEYCMSVSGETREVRQVEEFSPSSSQELSKCTVRVYSPFKYTNVPAILFIHGGAWVAGSIETHDNLARFICDEVNAKVISVSYSLSPESKYPTALNECYAALEWLDSKRDWLMVSDYTAVVGDSSGANMAIAIAIKAIEQKGPAINQLVLINPEPDLRCGGTLERCNDTFDFLRWQTAMYVDTERQALDPYVSPQLHQATRLLPNTLVITAENDELRSIGEQFANKLKSEGVKVNLYCQYDTHHLAARGARVEPSALESLEVAVSALRGSVTYHTNKALSKLESSKNYN